MKQELADFLVSYFGHSIRFHGPYSARFQSYGERFAHTKNGRYAEYSEPNIRLEDGCYLTQNLLHAFRVQLKKVNFSVLPSGSNCFSKLYRLRTNISRIDQLCDGEGGEEHHPKGGIAKAILQNGETYTRKLKHSWSNRRVTNFYTLPIHNLEWQRELQGDGFATIMSAESLLVGFRDAAREIAKEHPDASVENYDDFVFHPMLAAISMAQYKDYAKRIMAASAQKKVLLKSHPGCPDDFSDAFPDSSVYKIPKSVSHLPGELIYFQRPTTYVGYLSALLHFVPEEHRVLIEPPEDVRRNYDGQKFNPMLFALNERKLMRSQR